MNNLEIASLAALLEGIDNPVSALANASAYLNDLLEDVNWVGFYTYDGEKLVLGPFQGHPACTPLTMDKGVCARAAREEQNVRVDNVHAFPGHIACDSASQSEIVLPLFKDGVLYGVLDIDAPVPSRFSADDEAFLDAACRVIEQAL